MTDMAGDLDALRKDAARWSVFAGQVAEISHWGDTLTLALSDEVELIKKYLVAYNVFCHTFSTRGQAGNKAMIEMGTALDGVAKDFQQHETPY